MQQYNAKVDKEIFNYGHRIFQIRDSVFPNPSCTQALSVSLPWATAGPSAGCCYHHWDRQWPDHASHGPSATLWTFPTEQPGDPYT